MTFSHFSRQCAHSIQVMWANLLSAVGFSEDIVNKNNESRMAFYGVIQKNKKVDVDVFET